MTDITEFGVSDTLMSIFEGLRQASGSLNTDVAKYHNNDIDKVARRVCQRNYGKLCLELCYLSWAVTHAYNKDVYGRPLLSFFWMNDVTTPRKFRSAFSQPWESDFGSVTLLKEVLSINVGGVKFDISPTRAGVLSVLMEFLLSVNPNLIEWIEKDLHQANDKAIKALSSRLQKAIYDFIDDHLPRAQVLNRFRYIQSWMHKQGLQHDSFDDQAILDFWVEASVDEESEGYVLYSTALYNVLDAIEALQTVNTKTMVGYADTLGGGEAEVDPGKVHEGLLYTEHMPVLLSTLTQAPKCITQSQAALCKPLAEYSGYISRFMLAFMRLSCFSGWQSVLVQAKRQSSEQLKAKLSAPPVDGYTEHKIAMNDTQQALGATRDALLHILWVLKPNLAMAEHLDSIRASEAESISQWLAKERESMHSFTDEDAEALHEQLCLRSSSYKDRFDVCEKAFNKNSKAGFKVMPEAELSETYHASYEQVIALKGLISEYTAHLEKMSETEPLSTTFASDVFIFSERFNQIYGEVNASR